MSKYTSSAGYRLSPDFFPNAWTGPKVIGVALITLSVFTEYLSLSLMTSQRRHRDHSTIGGFEVPEVELQLPSGMTLSRMYWGIQRSSESVRPTATTPCVSPQRETLYTITSMIDILRYTYEHLSVHQGPQGARRTRG